MDLTNDVDKLLSNLANELKDVIYSYVAPPNAPRTIQKKGFDFPLIETGEMVESITYRRTELSGEVGLFDSENATKMHINEYGAPSVNIPPRPAFRITADQRADEVIDEFELAVFLKAEEEILRG